MAINFLNTRRKASSINLEDIQSPLRITESLTLPYGLA
ncbi:hypothetical protein NHE_0329 [Neorickettsia helminthoeca str. Oregon]|uniref:Uncharacterized protein n=1 Tax=Neorickettsia helminthoeca str. Oregon TaxID=1286528 RepID=X5H3Y3_9RICK|nr:hypothetical protein NHE_0329 [Neorickettsia helminthoeca str. Oregon]